MMIGRHFRKLCEISLRHRCSGGIHLLRWRWCHGENWFCARLIACMSRWHNWCRCSKKLQGDARPYHRGFGSSTDASSSWSSLRIGWRRTVGWSLFNSASYLWSLERKIGNKVGCRLPTASQSLRVDKWFEIARLVDFMITALWPSAWSVIPLTHKLKDVDLFLRVKRRDW